MSAKDIMKHKCKKKILFVKDIMSVKDTALAHRKYVKDILSVKDIMFVRDIVSVKNMFVRDIMSVYDIMFIRDIMSAIDTKTTHTHTHTRTHARTHARTRCAKSDRATSPWCTSGYANVGDSDSQKTCVNMASRIAF